jgi:hypothetical protein
MAAPSRALSASAGQRDRQEPSPARATKMSRLKDKIVKLKEGVMSEVQNSCGARPADLAYRFHNVQHFLVMVF